MSTFEFDDNGALAALVTRLNAAGVAAGLKAHKVTQHYGVLLQTAVKANASGRPGPRAPTGDYRRSINLRVGMEGAAVAARVGTTRVQSRRLEFGFVGTDSIGRTFAAPPYPHFGPAFDEVAPKYEAAITAIGVDALDVG